MALKGPFGFAGGRLVASNAYAVVDAVHVDKGGMASVHVSVYATPPEVKSVEEERKNEALNIVELVKVEHKDRGPVVEHYSCGEVDTKGKDPFVAAYEQLPSLDTRFKEMQSA